MTHAERNYDASDREALALAFFANHFRHCHTSQLLRVIFLDRYGKIPGFALVFRDTANIQNFGTAKFRHFTIFDISAAIYFRRGVEGMV